MRKYRVSTDYNRDRNIVSHVSSTGLRAGYYRLELDNIIIRIASDASSNLCRDYRCRQAHATIIGS